jgi:uncharacterized membrane protein YkgB
LNNSAHFNDRSKAVADGAISYYIDHFVSTRIAKFTYGTDTSELFLPKSKEHKKRLEHKFQSEDGNYFISGAFGVILQAVSRSNTLALGSC